MDKIDKEIQFMANAGDISTLIYSHLYDQVTKDKTLIKINPPIAILLMASEAAAWVISAFERGEDQIRQQQARNKKDESGKNNGSKP